MEKEMEAIRKARENVRIFLKEKNESVRRFIIVVLVMSLLLALIETLWQGILMTDPRLNFFLVIVIVLVFSLFPAKRKARIPRELTAKDYNLISVTGVACILIVLYTIHSLGWFSYAISIMAGMLVILTSILTMKEE